MQKILLTILSLTTLLTGTLSAATTLSRLNGDHLIFWHNEDDGEQHYKFISIKGNDFKYLNCTEKHGRFTNSSLSCQGKVRETAVLKPILPWLCTINFNGQSLPFSFSPSPENTPVLNLKSYKRHSQAGDFYYIDVIAKGVSKTPLTFLVKRLALGVLGDSGSCASFLKSKALKKNTEEFKEVLLDEKKNGNENVNNSL